MFAPLSQGVADSLTHLGGEIGALHIVLGAPTQQTHNLTHQGQ
jgi:hypothetical protein